MHRPLAAAAALLLAAGLATPATATPAAVPTAAAPVVAVASTPVPGRFCATWEHGKKVRTVKYGWLKCLPSGKAWRWKRI